MHAHCWNRVWDRPTVRPVTAQPIRRSDEAGGPEHTVTAACVEREGEREKAYKTALPAETGEEGAGRGDLDWKPRRPAAGGGPASRNGGGEEAREAGVLTRNCCCVVAVWLVAGRAENGNQTGAPGRRSPGPDWVQARHGPLRKPGGRARSVGSDRTPSTVTPERAGGARTLRFGGRPPQAAWAPRRRPHLPPLEPGSF
ncbi:hypothetical protein GW7_04542 [Heterocephalus glaber]|uniref:Uncharacterized protein n=1 Tax=Heterocephalus glaber TaxID=10181 RepID=G5C446_HETGA|nr:hypothetical protein GW7_04542 [Heterocephalus glaber]